MKKTEQDIIAEAIKGHVDNNDYDVDFGDYSYKRVLHKGQRVGSIIRVNMADEGEPDRFEHIATMRVSDSKGGLHDRRVGGKDGFHPTHDSALQAIKSAHSKAKFKDFVH